MKKNLRILTFALAAAFVFAACDSGGGDPPPPVDNPGKGEMTAATAANIFDYSAVTGGVQIDKFKDVNALRAYIDAGSPARSPSGPMRAEGDKTLVLNKIAGVYIVSIADNAFNPGEGAATLGDFNVKLPEKLASIGDNSFTKAGIATLLVSAAVQTALGSKITTVASTAKADGTGVTVVAVADVVDETAPFLGDGVFVQADGSLYINAVIYEYGSMGETAFPDKKFVGAWNGDPWSGAPKIKPDPAEYVENGRLTITISVPRPEDLTAWDDATFNPPDMKICEITLFGMDAANYIPDDQTGADHDLRLHLSDENEGVLMYANKAGTITGGNTNITLRAGWNFVIYPEDEANSINRDGSAEGYYWWYPEY